MGVFNTLFWKNSFFSKVKVIYFENSLFEKLRRENKKKELQN